MRLNNIIHLHLFLGILRRHNFTPPRFEQGPSCSIFVNLFERNGRSFKSTVLTFLLKDFIYLKYILTITKNRND